MRGPSYGGKTPSDFGLLRTDWTPRPSYDAVKTMTTMLGPEPKYLGWLNIDNGGFGFDFGTPKGNVLVAWGNAKGGQKIKFDAAVQVTDLTGKETPLAAGQELALTRIPVYIAALPEANAALAQSNAAKPFPWGGDFSKTKTVACRIGANIDLGLKQSGGDKMTIVNDLVESWGNTTVPGKPVTMRMFRVAPSFVGPDSRNLELTLVARRLAADKPSKLKIYFYESAKGYRPPDNPVWDIPAGDQWQEHTWKVSDANFVGQWGYNIALQSPGPNGCLIKEVRLTKAGP